MLSGENLQIEFSIIADQTILLNTYDDYFKGSTSYISLNIKQLINISVNFMLDLEILYLKMLKINKDL